MGAPFLSSRLISIATPSVVATAVRIEMTIRRMDFQVSFFMFFLFNGLL